MPSGSDARTRRALRTADSHPQEGPRPAHRRRPVTAAHDRSEDHTLSQEPTERIPMASPTTPEAPRLEPANDQLSRMAALVNDIKKRDRTSYFFMPEEAS